MTSLLNKIIMQRRPTGLIKWINHPTNERRFGWERTGKHTRSGLPIFRVWMQVSFYDNEWGQKILVCDRYSAADAEREVKFLLDDYDGGSQ